jgi:hypothetical protein
MTLRRRLLHLLVRLFPLLRHSLEVLSTLHHKLLPLLDRSFLLLRRSLEVLLVCRPIHRVHVLACPVRVFATHLPLESSGRRLSVILSPRECRVLPLVATVKEVRRQTY